METFSDSQHMQEERKEGEQNTGEERGVDRRREKMKKETEKDVEDWRQGV